MAPGGLARSISTPLDRVNPTSAQPSAKGPIIGIDLGVASCKVAVVGKNGAEVITREGRSCIPSYVAVDRRGEMVVGQAARRILASTPELGIWGPKALLEQGFDEPGAKAWRSQFHCKFFARTDRGTDVELGEEVFSAHELVAMLLCEAREWAQCHLGQPVERAVVSIPPSLDGRFLGLVREISRLAGLHLERTIFEPAAVLLAAMSVRPPVATERTVAICDWGASCFRFSLVKTQGTKGQILVSMSEPAVSGFEIDRWFYGRLLREAGVDGAAITDSGGAAVARFLAAAESTKIALSEKKLMKVSVPAAYLVQGALRDLALTIKREALEEYASHLVDRALKLCEEILATKSLSPADVDEVIIVGDQSRMPLVQERSKRFFPFAQAVQVDPTSAIALGAAALAAQVRQAAAR
jgi:molecular chaperone DnaK (HSP70)